MYIIGFYKLEYLLVVLIASVCNCTYNASNSTPDIRHNNEDLDVQPSYQFPAAYYVTSDIPIDTSIIGAAYFMTNDPRGNSVISNAILPDGRLKFGNSFRTGGFGGYIFSTQNTSGTPDALGSQHSLIVNEDVLFVVNAGSNTVSMFSILRNLPTELRLVSSVSCGGHFPVALAFSRKLQMLCVLNGGERNGIQCFSFRRDVSGSPYLDAMPQVRLPLGLPLTTPPLLYGSVSDIIFSPDSTQILVAVKGNPNTGVRGFIMSFQIRPNQMVNGVRNRPNGSLTPFGMAFVPGTGINSEPILVYADLGGNGFGVIKLLATGVIEASDFTIIPGQANTCWTVFSPRSGNLITTDTVTNLVTESAIDKETLSAQILNQYHLPGNPLDSAVVSLRENDVLYVFASALPGIHVLSLAFPGQAQLLQQYSPPTQKLEFPLNTGALGLATYLINSFQ